MTTLVDVTVPSLPDCWDTCGNCADGEITVVEWLVKPGDPVKRFDPIVVIESQKTTYEIPAQESGKVTELCVPVGASVGEGSLLLRLMPT